MAARLDALHHQRVGAGGARHSCLGRAVTVTHTSEPTSRSDETTSDGGHPNVNDTTGTGVSRRTASLAPTRRRRTAARPHRVRAARRGAQRLGMSTAGSPGTKTLTPNGAGVPARTSPISVASASAARYPAARNPSPPASLTATVSAGVDGPPAIGARTIGWSSRSRITVKGYVFPSARVFLS